MKRIFDKYKNFVFVGESGCGKTELSLNFARELANEGEKVILFDMDQTKPLFRARNAAENRDFELMEISWQEQLLDTPVVPPAVRESLLDNDCRAVLDVGGNELGVHMIGQYSDLLNREDCGVFFVINPNRIWSETLNGIEETYSEIAISAGLNNLKIVINPNFGKVTTIEDVVNGFNKIRELLPEVKPAFLGITEQLVGNVVWDNDIPILAVRRYCQLPWEKQME